MSADSRSGTGGGASKLGSCAAQKKSLKTPATATPAAWSSPSFFCWRKCRTTADVGGPSRSATTRRRRSSSIALMAMSECRRRSRAVRFGSSAKMAARGSRARAMWCSHSVVRRIRSRSASSAAAFRAASSDRSSCGASANIRALAPSPSRRYLWTRASGVAAAVWETPPIFRSAGWSRVAEERFSRASWNTTTTCASSELLLGADVSRNVRGRGVVDATSRAAASSTRRPVSAASTRRPTIHTVRTQS
mmetsp:Transcript_17617/g.54929  ORF Transcript_17617/g.54929 Transcript_17617/m.54929 type:complete len:249 (-) Transcript_17617:244-990(-)